MTSSFLPDDAYTGGIDYDWRLSPIQHLRLLGGQPYRGQHRGDHPAAGEQRARFPAPRRGPRGRRSDADDARRAMPARSASARFAARRRASTAYLGYKSPGFDMNDLGFHAPRRRADSQQLVPVARHHARAGSRARSTSTSTSTRAGTSAATGCSAAATSTCTGRGRTTTPSASASTSTRAPLRDRVTRGGPAVLGNRNASTLVLRRHRQPQGAVVQLQRRPQADGHGTTRHNIGPCVNWRPTAPPRCRNMGFRYNINNDDSQWVENEDARRRPTALCVRPASSSGRWRSPSASTTR